MNFLERVEIQDRCRGCRFCGCIPDIQPTNTEYYYLLCCTCKDAKEMYMFNHKNKGSVAKAVELWNCENW